MLENIKTKRCKGNGRCYIRNKKYQYSKTNYTTCNHDCVLIPCNQCGKKYPQWHYDFFLTGFCYDCNKVIFPRDIDEEEEELDCDVWLEAETDDEDDDDNPPAKPEDEIIPVPDSFVLDETQIPQWNLRYTCEKQYKHNPLNNYNQNQQQHQNQNHSEYGSRIDSIDICSGRNEFVVLHCYGLL